MRKNIFLHELKMYIKSAVTWSVSIAALIEVFGSLYSGFAEDAELLSEMMDKFPPQLLAAFGMTGVDLSTVPGYFGLIFLFGAHLSVSYGRQTQRQQEAARQDPQRLCHSSGESGR